uniref:aldehyde dehydrogenase family 3 member F1 n=1 Tax=Fragaria vesca subsp. vesca TaxID=101020 RepID=UPI0005C855BE|nr:PREDICTED: aldehyde dehydrogenase family 3 member F1 [Fragaria vesca subsp. vesca]
MTFTYILLISSQVLKCIACGDLVGWVPSMSFIDRRIYGVCLCNYISMTKLARGTRKLEERNQTNAVRRLCNITMEAMSEIAEATLRELRETFRSGRTRSVAWRKTQLSALRELIRDNEEKIFEGLYQDLGKHPIEAYRDEVGVLIKSINYALSNLDKWVATKKGKLPLLLFPARGELVPEPLGVVLIFASWNYPISLALEPVIGAIAAGNTVVLKPSDQSPACSSIIAKTIPQYMDPKAIRIIEGGAQISEILLQHKWDKIFFTGSPQVGRAVMTAAAKHLTPVTLELGGKCPVILDSLSNPSDLKVAIKRIVSGKWGPCSGQACIGVDYMLVEEKFAPTVIELLKKTIKKFYTESPKDANCIARIVNKKHFQRVQNLLKEPLVEASIVHGGSLDEEKLFIEPIVLLNPPLDSAIMNEEIFGPLLPVITLKNIQESIEFINTRPKPLTIYAFTKDENFKKKILSETSSGGVTFNDVLIQFICDTLPFGGVGSSGFGRYHGKFSFDTFSHEKAVFQGGFFPELEPRYPPWNNFKMKFIRLAYDLDYFGLVLLLLGLKRY